jgi:glycerol-3-phosphate O-acyltransferase
MLAYYRNNIIHHFVNDSLIALALLGINNLKDISLGIPVEEVW